VGVAVGAWVGVAVGLRGADVRVAVAGTDVGVAGTGVGVSGSGVAVTGAGLGVAGSSVAVGSTPTCTVPHALNESAQMRRNTMPNTDRLNVISFTAWSGRTIGQHISIYPEADGCASAYATGSRHALSAAHAYTTAGA
jgi:hypothetical protein